MTKPQWTPKKKKRAFKAPGESKGRLAWRQLVNNRLLSIEIANLEIMAKLGMEAPMMMHEAKMFIRDAVLSKSVEEE